MIPGFIQVYWQRKPGQTPLRHIMKLNQEKTTVVIFS